MTPWPRSGLLPHRFFTQYLAGPLLADPVAVVRHLGAVQSQDYPGAKWSIGQRVKHGSDAAIDRAMDSGAILRTHILRPTWHFVLPADIGWMLALTAPKILRGNHTQERRLGLDAKVMSRCEAVIGKALEGGEHRTREQLSEILGQAKLKASGQRLAYIVMHAELTALICSGALQGKKQTYALLDERAPKTRKLGRAEGVVELLRRFLVGHSPATLKHFSWWSGVGVTEGKGALDEVRKEFEVRKVDGVEWFGTPPKQKTFKGRAWLIPEYDELLVGAPEMGLARFGSERRSGRRAPRFDRPAFVDGVCVGSWKRTLQGMRATLELAPYVALSTAAKQALKEECERYSRFLGIPVEFITRTRASR